MSDSYRDLLFSNYHKSHVSHLDTDDNELKLGWFAKYVELNYSPFLQERSPSETQILEIGCNKGYLISALASLGFQKLKGIDLSPDDVAIAKRLVPKAELLCVNAESYLKQHANTYDVIVLKAVLEHINKESVLSFLTNIRNALKQDGAAIIDVPNMDWLLAQHERYMDFTHELGFTRESLSQVMRNVFDDVSVFKGKAVPDKRLLVRFMRPLVVSSVNVIFRFIGEGMHDTWWDNRSIIAVARK